MARSTPRVEGGILLGLEGQSTAIAVGTPAWYAWLEQATTFAFTSEQGSFTARKERSGRSGWYWKAYRKHNGTLHRAYLGKSDDLTFDRLNAIASDLARRALEQQAIESTTALGVARVAPGVTAHDDPLVPLPTGTVTFLFTDIEGSTQLWEQHTELMPAALARHDAILRRAIAAHGGVVFKTVGDSCHAVFARAADALEAALAAQRELHVEPWGSTGPLHVRMALHTGAAEVRDGDYFGPPLNRVARILALGHGGQILLGRAPHDLVADDLPSQTTLSDLGEHALKDLSRPEQIFQLISPDLPAEFPALRTLEARPPAAPTQPFALLATKLYVPSPRSHLVSRARLVERLQAGIAGKLTLIAAPAGFGKTTLLSEWHASHAGRDVAIAWIALDPGDNDGVRFWSYIITALDQVAPGVGASSLALLQSPQPPIEAILTALLNALSATLAHAVLVLDDYHMVDTPSIHQAMTFLLDHLPPHLHLVIATRVDPPLPLTRLRARGELTELRAADLRFTPDEAAAFLTTVMGLPLSADEVVALEARTEGWIAGLQFAALAMRDRTDRTGFIAAFTGSHRFVVDYLAEEVIDRLPRHLQTFVLQTSILDRMCGPLCDAVLLGDTASPSAPGSPQQAYSQTLLANLERINMFLVPLDDNRHWYRYHHLFTDVLRTRLSGGVTAETVAMLHQRASAWYEENMLLPEAIHHALTAHDWEHAAKVIRRAMLAADLQGQIHTMLGWLKELPERYIVANPTLCVYHAVTLLHTNQLETAAARLQDAEHAISPDTPAEDARGFLGWITLNRGAIARAAGDIARCVAFSAQVLDLLPETEFEKRTPALVNAAHAYLVSGDVTPAAEHRVASATMTARVWGNRLMLLRSITNQARLHVLQGRLHQAAATYRQALHLAPGAEGLEQLVGSPAYYFGLGDLSREWNDLDTASTYIAQGKDMTKGTFTVDAETIILGYLTGARIQQARGEYAEALVALEELEVLARQRQFVAHLITRTTAVQAQLSLTQGNLRTAVGWAVAMGLHADDEIGYPREMEYLALARVLIAQGRSALAGNHIHDALLILDRLLLAAEAGGRMGSAIEMLALRALALQANDDTTGAMTALDRALTLAEPEGYVRIFVDEGPPMVDLLREAHARGIAPHYVAKLLTAFPDFGSQIADFRLKGERSTLAEPLTDRELEVLHLMAAGRSNVEIAQVLVVAVSTIKTHVNRIFGKLGATSRTQAVARAHELHLL